jgi:hypothetical protein
MGEWHCTDCATHIASHPGSPLEDAQHIDAYKVYRAHFAPSFEKEDKLREDGFGEEIDTYIILQGTKVPRQELRPDTTWTNREKQGLSAAVEDTRYGHTLGEPIREKLVCHPDAINPHLDTHPTGKYNIQLRPIPRATPEYLVADRKKTQPVEYSLSVGPTRAIVYDPEGRVVGMLNPERLAILTSRYAQTKQHRPHILKEYSAGSLEADIAKLLHRYREGAKISGTQNKVKLSNHWAVPHETMGTFKEFLGTDKERFGSPLNFNPDLQEYWSIHPEDQLFGAHHDAYGCQWTASSEANAEYEDKELYKAMRWAVHSAAANPSTPTLTLLEARPPSRGARRY